MSGVNRAHLVGHLGADPEIKYLPNGDAVANFSIATSESWNDKQGQKQERTEWHRVVVWRKLAENCAKYLHKGSQAYVEGKIQTRQWEDKEGGKRYTTEIVASNVVFLSKSEKSEKSEKKAESFDYGPPPMDDDVPF